ncbi:MAG TPA: 6,7-dimethyl-8-ribityllumazine synthase [Bacteroidales bacterium]|nr:6,7-dimethyl-8-ribityllumazine synthase [Paludibacteraceae bacterium]HOH83987.1 6,7-dimethyl-8-ribityllumazine synthase [Bacteroidales bacterium]HPI29987.1 6,7-dimethyl-8-ribityllumazine synthase [Bacteroidales bacterium]HQN16506.1 6,7-dimethyl-8-ribityllumazine synthase [Bacteroidales bacterium]HQP16170.1 6,7-dimethyl-8-ribityllumazine synthase [Bacteroidales bacterium]
MSSKKKNLSEYTEVSGLLSPDSTIGIVVSEWNPEITESLSKAAVETLLKHGIKSANIIIEHVPGSFELPLGAQYLIKNKNVDAVICLGCVIQGETRHFEFICQAVSQHILRLNIDHNLPVIFGVLTTDNFQQAKDRAGGKHGNKGTEAAVAAIKMLLLRDK